MKLNEKVKKLAALGLAAAMVVSPVTVNAASGGQSGSSSGSSVMEGVLPSDVVDVVLPTISDGTYNFVLDPANLLSQYDKDKATKYPTASSLYFANADGTNSGTSDIATCVNKSSTQIVLSVEVNVSNVKANPVTFTSSGNVESDTENNVFLGLVPTAKGTVAGNDDPTAGAATSAQTITVDATGKARAFFLMDGSTSNFDVTQSADATVASGHKYEYTPKESASWTTAGFALTGACNKTADWDDFNTASQDKASGENLSVDVAYSMDTLSDDQKAQMADETSPVSADTTTGLIPFAVNEAPKATYNLAYNKETGSKLVLDLGCGTLGATDVTAVYAPTGAAWTKAASKEVTSQTWFFDQATSTLIIGDGYGAAAPKAITAKLNDVAETIITIQLVDSKAPTATYELSYNKETGSSLVLDLGSGDLAATDVVAVYAPNGTEWVKSSTGAATNQTWYFDPASSTLHIGDGYGAAAPKALTAKLNDAANTIVTIQLV